MSISTHTVTLLDGRRMHEVCEDGVTVRLDGFVFMARVRAEAMAIYEHYLKHRGRYGDRHTGETEDAS